MDERLLQQLEEMEHELDAFQSALESIEESKELTKESTSALKKSQESLSQACDEFIPALEKQFSDFATDSTSIQNKIEALLEKLQSLDIHQFTEKLDNNGKYLTEQIATELDIHYTSMESLADKTSESIQKHTKQIIEKTTTALGQQAETSMQENSDRYITTLDKKLDATEQHILASQDNALSKIKEDFANQEKLTEPISEHIISIENEVTDQAKSINSISEHISTIEDDMKNASALIAQTRIISIAILVFSFIAVALSAIRFFV